MKFEDYDEIASGLTPENAVDTVRSILEKLKTDIVETDAATADLQNKIESANEKYKSLQIDYIQKFTSQSSDAIEDEEEDDVDVEKEIEAALANI